MYSAHWGDFDIVGSNVVTVPAALLSPERYGTANEPRGLASRYIVVMMACRDGDWIQYNLDRVIDVHILDLLLYGARFSRRSLKLSSGCRCR